MNITHVEQKAEKSGSYVFYWNLFFFLIRTFSLTMLRSSRGERALPARLAALHVDIQHYIIVHVFYNSPLLWAAAVILSIDTYEAMLSRMPAFTRAVHSDSGLGEHLVTWGAKLVFEWFFSRVFKSALLKGAYGARAGLFLSAEIYI